MGIVLQHNKFFDDHYWSGVSGMPDLDVEIFGDNTCEMSDAIDFEICLDDWWPWFTIDDEI